MNAYHQFESALNRLATTTSIIRTRNEDAVRFTAHGGLSTDVVARIEAAAERIEQAAARLEQII